MASEVIVLTTDASTFGGIQQYTRNWIRSLEELGHRPVAVDLRELRGSTPAGETTQLGRVRFASKARFARRAVGALSSATAGVVATHLSLAPIAAGLSTLGSVPALVALHGFEAWSPPRWSRALGPRVDFLAVSEFTRSAFQRASGVDGRRVRVLLNSLSPEFHEEALRQSQRRGLVRRPTGTAPSSPLRLVAVTRLDSGFEYKGVDRTLEAMAMCDFPVSIRVVGGGNMLEHYDQTAVSLGVDATFLGRLSNEELVRELRDADVHVLPSWATGPGQGEGFGIVFVEAAYCGTPSVAVDSGGVREAVDADAGGLILESGRPDEIAEALGRLYSEPELLTRLSRGAAIWADRFTPQAFRSNVDLEVGSWTTP